jgi:hypothetical protein
MKLLLIVITTLALTAFAADHFWRGKTLSADEVGKRWGKTELNIEKFQKGDEKVRAAMAYSLLKNQGQYKGKFVLDIRKDFGSPDGFYFSDVFPAYLIQRAHSQNEEAWQIVFLLDKDRKVQKVIVHKNCCD